MSFSAGLGATPTCLALLGFGANLGDRMACWNEVLAHLPMRGIEVIEVSRLFETLPVGGPEGQSAFLNAALTVRTRLSAPELVADLLGIEREIGRIRQTRWGPRLVDLDLMLFRDDVIDSATCLVPHPRMTFRRFVIEPACQVAADWTHPITGCTLAALSKQLQRLNRRARLVYGDQSPENLPRDRIADLALLFQKAGWRLETTKLMPSEPCFSLVVTCDRHPQPGMVSGPYLVLPTDEPDLWETEVAAAIQALSA